MEHAVAPSEMTFTSTVSREYDGKLLLEMLAIRFTYHSKTVWEEKIEAGDIFLNGALAKKDSTLCAGDKISYRVKNYSEPIFSSHIDIIFEDEEFMLLVKPAGVPVHHTGKIFYNTLVGIIRRTLNNPEMTPMHRLDRDTGGLMLFAKSRDTALRFQKNLDKILLKKFYVAAVRGVFPEYVDCTFSLSEAGGDRLESSKIRTMMVKNPLGKKCETIFRRIKVSEVSLGGIPSTISLVEAELKTGRKHQIRAHLAELGFPIIGDKIYAHDGFFYKKMIEGTLDESDYQILGAKFQLLFAYKVELWLPTFDSPRIFEVKLPKTWPAEL